MAVKEYLVSQVYPDFKAPNADLVAGRVVTADANGVVGYVASTTPSIVGILAQDVIAPNVNTHILSSVKHFARYGEQVGVYLHPGDIIQTDQTASNVAVGDKLYAIIASGADQGKLTNTSGANTTTDPVAVALSAGNAGSFVKIKLL